MPVYHVAQLVPDHSDGREPAEPDFDAVADQRPRAKAMFLRGLQENADQTVHRMDTELPRLGPVLIQMKVIGHTAALFAFAKVWPAPRPPQVLVAAALLGGFADADDAALEAAKTTPGFGNNPDLPPDAFADAAAEHPRRPLMIEAFGHADCYEDAPLRTLCYALADAFFEQFGGDPRGDGDGDGDGDAAG